VAEALLAGILIQLSTFNKKCTAKMTSATVLYFHNENQHEPAKQEFPNCLLYGSTFLLNMFKAHEAVTPLLSRDAYL